MSNARLASFRTFLAFLTVTTTAWLAAPAVAQTTVFINEIHYDNTGTDVGEAIEVAGPAGTDLSGWSLVLYNGSNSQPYNTIDLSGTLTDAGSGFGFSAVNFPTNGIQNGAPDGLALVDDSGTVIQFLSYEGSIVAAGGPASGLTSSDIGVSENSGTPIGFSLQLTGTGASFENFAWTADMESFGDANVGQTFGAPPPPPPGTVFINEIHYDNSGTDTGEAIEVAGPAGADLTGWRIVLYNGSSGSTYDTTTLSGVLADAGDGIGFAVETYPSNGIQNGSPDGVALVDAMNNVVEFLSYEGVFEATNGPANGMTSTNIGVAESSGTPAGFSLQLTGIGFTVGEFAWADASGSTFGAVNNGQTFGDAPPPPTPIYEIQGSGDASPLAGQNVSAIGIVTGDFQDATGIDGDLNGFYLQEEVGDGDAATSDGIFVFDGFSPDVDVRPGDKVRVIGSVAEFFGETQINALGGSVEVIGDGSVAPVPVTLPNGTSRQNGRGETIADLEQYEGMLVQFDGVYEVTEYFNLDRFGEIALAAGERFTQFTQDNHPDPVGFTNHLVDVGSRTLLLDDGLTVQNPDPIRYPFPALDSDNTVRGGDIATNLVGNIRYSRGSGGSGDENYRLEPVEEPVFLPVNLRTDTPDAVGGDIRVAGLNVLNFYTTIDQSGAQCFPTFTRRDCRGADSQTEFDRQLAKLVTAITAIDADVLGLIELENNYLDGADSAISTLASAINEDGRASCANYQAVDPGMDRLGDDTIAVGILYCADTLRIARDTQAAVLTDSVLADLDDDSDSDSDSDSDEASLVFNLPIFDGFATSRAPLAATFEHRESDEEFTVVVNHFKSKGDSDLGDPGSVCDPDPSADPNCDQGDGAGYWNQRRTDAAEAVLAWLATEPTGGDDEDIVILGDLNAYLMEDPIAAFEDAGFRNLVRGIPDAYSFVFDGQIGSLDYIFVDGDLFEAVTGFTEWHINADEPDALDYNLNFGRNPTLFDGEIPFRTSDHDPVIVGLDMDDDSDSDSDSDSDDD